MLLNRRGAGRGLVFAQVLGAAAVVLGVALTPELLRTPTATSAREVAFLTWRQAPYGIQSTSLDTADFNRDGYDDIAVLSGGTVELLLSDGNGNFSPPLAHRRGGAPAKQLIAKDFDHDASADVAVVYADGDLWVFLGDGQGGLSSGQRFPTGGSPTSLAATDFDRDGNLDVVVALAGGSITGRAQFMRNEGHANFTLVGDAAPVGRAPARIVAADFDADGYSDVAVTNQLNGSATVLFGDGVGGLTGRLTLMTTPTPDFPPPYGVTAGDLNGDGFDDLVVGNGLFVLRGEGRASGLEQNPLVPYGNAALFISDGKRGFSSPSFLPADNTPRELRILDLDHDGSRDIAVGGVQGVVALLAAGDGTFARRATTGATYGQALTAGDFNGDGRMDLATSGTLPRVDVFLGQGGGRFPSPFFIETIPNPELGSQLFEAIQAAATDVNNDGVADLVSTTGRASTIVTFLGTGDGELAAPVASPVKRQTGYFAAGDFNRDGSMDVVISGSGQVLDLFLGDGHGRFTSGPRIAEGADFGKVIAADFNGDGVEDMAAVALRLTSNFTGVEAFLNQGDGRFLRTATLRSTAEPTVGVVGVLAGDLNGDSRPDLLLVNYGNSFSVFLGNGDGTFSDGRTVPAPTDGGIFGAALSDFDEDGHLDLAVSQGGGSQRPGFGNFWLHGDGLGGFLNPVHLTPEYVGLDTQGTFTGVITTQDFNGDGHVDIAAASFNGTVIFQGDGQGHFRRSSYFAMQTTEGAELTAADLNGDGLIDLTTPAQVFAEDGSSALRFTLLFNTTQPVTIVLGDTDCNEAVTGADLAALARRLFSPLYLLACVGADANADRSLSVADLVAATKRIRM